MRKFFYSLIALMFALPSCAREDGRAISFDRLPEASQTLLNTYFGEKTVMIVKKDNMEYEVVFKGGEGVEFDLRGNWKEINCHSTSVPDDLVPEQIRSFVHENYPESHIVKIERDRGGYDVKLSSRIELEFNRNFALIDLDYD